MIRLRAFGGQGGKTVSDRQGQDTRSICVRGLFAASVLRDQPRSRNPPTRAERARMSVGIRMKLGHAQACFLVALTLVLRMRAGQSGVPRSFERGPQQRSRIPSRGPALSPSGPARVSGRRIAAWFLKGRRRRVRREEFAALLRGRVRPGARRPRSSPPSHARRDGERHVIHSRRHIKAYSYDCRCTVVSAKNYSYFLGGSDARRPGRPCGSGSFSLVAWCRRRAALDALR